MRGTISLARKLGPYLLGGTVRLFGHGLWNRIDGDWFRVEAFDSAAAVELGIRTAVDLGIRTAKAIAVRQEGRSASRYAMDQGKVR